MKEYFKDEIKPLNDKLGRDLGAKADIKYELSEHKLHVKITYTSHTGNRVTRIAGTKGFYEALRLLV